VAKSAGQPGAGFASAARQWLGGGAKTRCRTTLHPGQMVFPDRHDKVDFFAVLYFKFHIFYR
jgi:hypothetical protein